MHKERCACHAVSAIDLGVGAADAVCVGTDATKNADCKYEQHLVFRVYLWGPMHWLLQGFNG